MTTEEPTQLDRIEQKLDRLLELSEPITFRLGQSTFQHLTPGGPAVCIGQAEIGEVPTGGRASEGPEPYLTKRTFKREFNPDRINEDGRPIWD